MEGHRSLTARLYWLFGEMIDDPQKVAFWSLIMCLGSYALARAAPKTPLTGYPALDFPTTMMRIRIVFQICIELIWAEVFREP